MHEHASCKSTESLTITQYNLNYLLFIYAACMHEYNMHTHTRTHTYTQARVLTCDERGIRIVDIPQHLQICRVMQSGFIHVNKMHETTWTCDTCVVFAFPWPLTIQSFDAVFHAHAHICKQVSREQMRPLHTANANAFCATKLVLPHIFDAWHRSPCRLWNFTLTNQQHTTSASSINQNFVCQLVGRHDATGSRRGLLDSFFWTQFSKKNDSIQNNLRGVYLACVLRWLFERDEELSQPEHWPSQRK